VLSCSVLCPVLGILFCALYVRACLWVNACMYEVYSAVLRCVALLRGCIGAGVRAALLFLLQLSRAAVRLFVLGNCLFAFSAFGRSQFGVSGAKKKGVRIGAR
jgi:hypothetical protein